MFTARSGLGKPPGSDLRTTRTRDAHVSADTQKLARLGVIVSRARTPTVWREFGGLAAPRGVAPRGAHHDPRGMRSETLLRQPAVGAFLARKVRCGSSTATSN